MTSHPKPLNTKEKTMTYIDGAGKPDHVHVLGQARKCGGVKQDNGIQSHPLLITGSPMIIQM